MKILVIVATNGREIGQGSRTSVFCNFTLIDQPVNVVWKSEGRILEAADGIVAVAQAFGGTSQIHKLDISSAIVDTTYTCSVNSANYPKEAEREKSISVSVFGK